MAQALGLSDDVLASTLDDAIINGSDGIINVLKGTGVGTRHFAVKVGDEIIDRTIKENLRSYSVGHVLPKGAEAIAGDTWTIAQYLELRKLFILALAR